MSKIAGSREAVEAVAALRDKDTGLPMPYSRKIGGAWVNVCPRCESPLTRPPYRCEACGWTEADGYEGARRTVCRRLADIERDGAQWATEVPEEMAAEVETAKGKKDKDRSEREKKLAAVDAKAEETSKPEEPRRGGAMIGG